MRGLGLDPRRAAEVLQVAREAWSARAARARSALGAAAGQDLGPAPSAWRALLAAAPAPRVVPLGWA